MVTNDRVYCSEVARAAGDPPCGTAVHVEMWLLIEYPGPWKPKALEDNGLPDPIRAHLAALPEILAREYGARLRIQFIKQASSADVVYPRVFVADGRDGRVRLAAGELRSYAAIGELSAQQIASLTLPSERPVNGEMYLVCTNGQRDLCCARFGLPLFEALRIDYGDRIWQTTHVGGHRYAPNLVCLPSGLVYGFVSPEHGPGLVAGHDRGVPDLERLRGRSAWPPPAQAAEYYLRREQAVGELRFRSVDAQDGADRVTLEDAAGTPFVVVVQQVPGPDAPASCGAEPTPVERYRPVL